VGDFPVLHSCFRAAFEKMALLRYKYKSILPIAMQEGLKLG
jgi:hypothetical protein